MRNTGTCNARYRANNFEVAAITVASFLLRKGAAEEEAWPLSVAKRWTKEAALSALPLIEIWGPWNSRESESSSSSPGEGGERFAHSRRLELDQLVAKSQVSGAQTKAPRPGKVQGPKSTEQL